jgi:hypothetical protein
LRGRAAEAQRSMLMAALNIFELNGRKRSALKVSLKNKVGKYFLICLVADGVIVSLILLVLTVSDDGTCHTFLGGSFACSFSKYFKNDVLLSLALLARFILPILLIIPILGIIIGYTKQKQDT